MYMSEIQHISLPFFTELEIGNSLGNGDGSLYEKLLTIKPDYSLHSPTALDVSFTAKG